MSEIDLIKTACHLPLFLCEVINKYKILPNVALGWTKEKLCKWISGNREISLAFFGGTGKIIFFNCPFFLIKHFLSWNTFWNILFEEKSCKNVAIKKLMREPASTHVFWSILSTLNMLFPWRRIFSDLSVKPRYMNYVIKTTDRFCLWLVCDSVECRYFTE